MYPELDELLNFYSKTFCSRTCMLKTGYKPLSELQVVFNENDFHHLIGLHKVTKERASKNIDKIKKGTLTLYSVKQHKNFKDIKYRIIGFKYLENMFINPKCDICILAKDLKSNSMDIDLILFNNDLDDNSIMVLGLRRAKDSMTFYPTTLYKTHKNKFSQIRKTKVEGISWI